MSERQAQEAAERLRELLAFRGCVMLDQEDKRDLRTVLAHLEANQQAKVEVAYREAVTHAAEFKAQLDVVINAARTYWDLLEESDDYTGPMYGSPLDKAEESFRRAIGRWQGGDA